MGAALSGRSASTGLLEPPWEAGRATGPALAGLCAAWRAGGWRRVLGVLVLALGAAAAVQAQAPDPNEIETIRTRLQAARLAKAVVEQGPDGRLTLSGEYLNRAEVLTAFSIAQQVVGVRWVAPTTPEKIKYPFDNARDKFCAVLGTCKPAGGAAPPPPRTSTAPAGGPRGPGKYALVVGIGEFEALPRDNWLQYTARDAQLVHDYLVDPRGGNFPRGNVTLLTDRQATRAGIEAAMDRIAQQVGPDDLVVLYISSHGTPPNDRGTMQIVTYDTQLRPREKSFLTSLTDDKVADFAQRLGKARLLAVLDTCYSGAAFEKVPGFLATGAKDLRLDEERKTVVGLSGKSMVSMATGGKDLRFEDEKSPLPPPDNQGPRVLMSASDAGQKAWESERLQQSFFTYHLVDALRRQPDVEKAYLSAKPVVAADVMKDKRQVQTPQAVFMPRGTSFRIR